MRDKPADVLQALTSWRVVLVASTHEVLDEWRRFWEGIYVLYTYGSRRSTSQGVQRLLSKPSIGADVNVLRHMTFCQA